MGERAIWAAIAGLVLLSGGISLTVEAIDLVRNETLARFCVGEAYPNTWRAKGEPGWVTEARLDALCAVTRWLREETGLALERER